MKDKRYSRYKRDDVLAQLAIYANKLKVQIVQGSMPKSGGYSLSLIRLDTGERLRCICLGRSSDWYHYSLNCPEWDHGITAIVAQTHDSCVPVPVLTMDEFKWYSAGKINPVYGPLQPPAGLAKGETPDDLFEHARRTEYGHNILIGALMCGRDDAFARLATFKPSTQRRIRAELARFRRRRPGRPLAVAPDPQSHGLKIVS